MNRQDKIEALRRLMKGEPMAKVIPTLEVFIVDHATDIHSLVMVGNRYGSVPTEQVSEYLANLREQNPLERLNVVRISKQEFDEISEALEREY